MKVWTYSCFLEHRSDLFDVWYDNPDFKPTDCGWEPSSVVCFPQFIREQNENKSTFGIINEWRRENSIEMKYDHNISVWYFKNELDAIQCAFTFDYLNGIALY